METYLAGLHNRCGHWWLIVVALLYVPMGVVHATTISWGSLGGADYYGKNAPFSARSPHVTFSEISVGPIQRVETEMLLTANVNTVNSGFYIWASAEVDGVWTIFAKTNLLPLYYGQSTNVEFNIEEEIVGGITGLHFDSVFQSGEVDFSNMLSTRLVFADAVSAVPEPNSYLLFLLGLSAILIASRAETRIVAMTGIDELV